MSFHIAGPFTIADNGDCVMLPLLLAVATAHDFRASSAAIAAGAG
jgi:hypothetical protein